MVRDIEGANTTVIIRCRKLTHNGQATDVLYFGPSTRWHRQSAGTTVCVRDAFHNVEFACSSAWAWAYV